jgi:23S rRNA-/tRNA-specific pseudouridylate synthase
MSHIWLDFIKKELEKQDLENPARKINCTKNNVEEKSEKKDEISLKRKCDNESIHSLTNDTKRAKIDDVYDDNDVIVID